MSDLSDLELCKRIAEIEGHELCEEWNCCASGILIGKGDGDLKDYNPLKDDALCFKLMIKHQIKVMYETSPYYYHASKVIQTPGKKPFRVGESDSNPNRAILLAIIEAHNE